MDLSARGRRKIGHRLQADGLGRNQRLALNFLAGGFLSFGVGLDCSLTNGHKLLLVRGICSAVQEGNQRLSSVARVGRNIHWLEADGLRRGQSLRWQFLTDACLLGLGGLGIKRFLLNRHGVLLN